MTTDDDFAQHLRARAHDLAPHVTVHTSRVLPRARHRRGRIRSVQAVGAVGILAAMGAGADGLTGWVAPWRSPEAVGPAVAPTETTAPVVDVPTPAATEQVPAPTPTQDPAAESAGRYWYTLITSAGPEGQETHESWLSRELPGLLVSNGDLANASAVGPVNVVGRFKIDGVWVDMLRDPSALPADGVSLAEVLRASVEPDRRSGSDDDKVFDMVRDLLMEGGLLPQPLLEAAWDAAAALPGSAVTPGADASGRTGEVLQYNGTEADVRLVRDPATGLLLEQSTGSIVSLYTVQELTDVIPLEPTLEMSGCTAWSSC